MQDLLSDALRFLRLMAHSHSCLAAEILAVRAVAGI